MGQACRRPAFCECHSSASRSRQAGRMGRLVMSGCCNFNSVQSGWLTKSVLGKHSALLGGEVLGINRRYYHCKATGGRHVCHSM